jgi:hypothetical protein
LPAATLPAPIAIGLIVTIGVAVIIIIAATRGTHRGCSHETESRSSNGRLVKRPILQTVK